MLTAKELRQLRDQDAPLGGRPLFEDVWRDRAIAEAFVDWARRDQFAAWVDWIERTPADRLERYFFEMVTDLELAVRDLTDAHARFLEACPEEVRDDAIRRVREALGTAPPKRAPKRTPPPAHDPAQLRRAHHCIDRLWAAHDRDQPATRPELEELRAALAELGREEVADVDKLLAAAAPDRRAVYAVIYMLRATLPYHAPLLRQLAFWLNDPNRAQRDTLRLLDARWIDRLRELAPIDREEAAGKIQKAITSPKLAADRDALLARLTG